MMQLRGIWNLMEYTSTVKNLTAVAALHPPWKHKQKFQSATLTRHRLEDSGKTITLLCLSNQSEVMLGPSFKRPYSEILWMLQKEQFSKFII
jgi:hypothetical protein